MRGLSNERIENESLSMSIWFLYVVLRIALTFVSANKSLLHRSFSISRGLGDISPGFSVSIQCVLNLRFSRAVD